MRIALAQIDPTLGAFSENREKILNFIKRAHQQDSDLIVFPEASLFGYHPVDLLERPTVVREQEAELKKLARQIPAGITVVVGAITTNSKPAGKPFLNSAVLLEKGKAPKIFAKQLLPTYDVFDEGRHIEPGDTTKNIVRIKGKRVLITICEDIWGWSKNARGREIYMSNPLKKIKSSSVDLVVNLSASPFTETKRQFRRQMVQQTAAHFKKPMVYVNMVGAQDELIFDGGSFVLSPQGDELARCARFEEDMVIWDSNSKKGDLRPQPQDKTDLIRQAIVMGIRDFARKVGFGRAHLGLSGGIDSAVVVCLAAEALGAKSVTAIGLPGPFNSPQSLDLAKKLAERLGVQWKVVDIAKPYESVVEALHAGLGKFEFGVVNENIQARLRQVMLMAYGNLSGSLLLNTSNKSELAVGYSTLYGDLAGGLSPIGDLLKEEVYALAELYNSEKEIIPQEIIKRPPSAELRPNQKDEDSLPPYSELDPAVKRMVENYRAPRTDLDRRILEMMMKSEFKRWQAPPILKVSDHAFGRGRRLPIAHKAIF